MVHLPTAWLAAIGAVCDDFAGYGVRSDRVVVIPRVQMPLRISLVSMAALSISAVLVGAASAPCYAQQLSQASATSNMNDRVTEILEDALTASSKAVNMMGALNSGCARQNMTDEPTKLAKPQAPYTSEEIIRLCTAAMKHEFKEGNALKVFSRIKEDYRLAESPAVLMSKIFELTAANKETLVSGSKTVDIPTGAALQAGYMTVRVSPAAASPPQVLDFLKDHRVLPAIGLCATGKLPTLKDATGTPVRHIDICNFAGQKLGLLHSKSEPR